MIKGNYLKGLKGLTKQDRQNWEKQYSSLLQGKNYDDDQLNQLYLNTKFKEAFGNQSDYSTLKTLNQEDRNKMLEQYNRNVAFKQSFGNRKDYDKLKALPSQIRNQIQDEAYVQNYALNKYKNNPNLTDIMTLTPTSLEKLIDSGYKSEEELKKIEKQENQNQRNLKYFQIQVGGIQCHIVQVLIYLVRLLEEKMKNYYLKYRMKMIN